MATVNKNFRIKQGLVVEGTTGTINGQNILTETGSDQYILNLVGGANLIDSVNSTQLEIINAELSVKANVFDAYGAASTAQSNAEDYADGLASNYDPAGSAATAQSNAEDYADGLASNYDPAGSAATAQSNAEDYADGLASNYDAAGSAATAQSNAEDYADGLASNYDPAGAAASAQTAAESTASGYVSTHSNLTTGVHGVTGDVVGTTDTQTISNKTLGGNLAAGGFKITNLGAPQDSTDAATKAYVDAVSEGLHIHASARVAISGNISIANGLENGDTAGGVTLATGDRVLVKDQTNSAENGIYVVQASGQALRATDFDTATEVDSGDFIFVTSGTYANTGWVQTLKPATIGSDPLSFTQFSGAGTFTAGNGLTLDGTVFEIDETITATRSYAESYADGLASNYDAAGSAATAQSNAEDYADGLASNYDAAGTASGLVDDLKDATTAFTAINVNSVAKQVAATTGNIVTAAATTAYSWAALDFRSAKFIVKAKYGAHTQVSDLVVTLDTSNNVGVSEYGITYSNGTELAAVTADYSGTDVRIRVTPANNNTEVIVVGTLIK
jgi:antitoxin component YwqK of YwqJK toxin-antitoxin module